MVRYMVLLNFTEKGISGVKDSVSRAESFRSAAAKVGATVDSVFWTLGTYDGMFMLSAADEATAAAIVLDVGRTNNVKTCMLRAFDAEEFKGVVAKLS